jgi:serine/threonine protein kinase
MKIIHCDFKARNILGSKSHPVKLPDFGLAQENIDEETELECSRSSYGSFQYCSPESLFISSRCLGHWSCWILIYDT